MKAGPDRKYTVEFREAAVRQVVDGKRSVPQVARALEMSDKTLANWVMKARKGQPLLKRQPAQPMSDLQAECTRLRQENARLKIEKEILKKGSGVLCQGVDVKYAWIEANRDSYSVTLMCRLLGVSRSGVHAARVRAPSARAQTDAQLTEEIRRQQRKHRGRYGRRRMSRALGDVLGRPVNEKQVGRLMRQSGLQSRKRRRFRVVTTDSKHAHPIAPNVLARDFAATAPNQKWLADLTYVPTAEGWLYLALILDLFSRKLVGWAMSDAMPQELTLEALHMALGWRDPPDGLTHHSDRGSQYAANGYRGVLAARGITVSMSRTGNCWDNAPMESVNGTVKVECVHGAQFKTRAEAAQALVEYFGYYNTERLHSSLGYLTPSEFERRWRAENEQRRTAAQ
ncbi:MAG: IS3 family transposase [Stutzerimonas stutzeri]|nr:MAG: IS3 family transposase [Stutzerimonas stutzeri]